MTMTDLEMTRLCAEAMGDLCLEHTEEGYLLSSYWQRKYDPIHDDAQAMALAKKFMLDVDFFSGTVSRDFSGEERFTTHSDESINRAIVECVAKMQKAK